MSKLVNRYKERQTHKKLKYFNYDFHYNYLFYFNLRYSAANARDSSFNAS